MLKLKIATFWVLAAASVVAFGWLFYLKTTHPFFHRYLAVAWVLGWLTLHLRKHLMRVRAEAKERWWRGLSVSSSSAKPDPASEPCQR